jgi:hypothetical protein
MATAPGLAYALARTGLQGPVTLDFDLPEPQGDGFETGDFGTLPWLRTGDADWTVATDQAFEGIHSAKSGDIADGGSTSLELDWFVQGDGPVTFRVKTDSEVAYDVLEFFVDGMLFETWSGQTGWTTYSAALATGTHNLRWVYRKDSSTSVGADAAWVDIVELPGTGLQPVPTIALGSPTLSFTLGAGETGSLPLDITNGGDGTLEYTITPYLPLGGGWIRGEPTAGTVHPGSTIPHTIVFDATAVPAGTHNGALQIDSNDPATPSSFVGVVLNVTPVSGVPGALPVVATLHGAVPNPFNPMAEIRFSLPRAGRVSLRVYDLAGRLVRTLVDGQMGPGHHSERWDGRDDAGLGVASGVYYARLVAAQETSIKPMTLVR